jgi:hypothetical protein
MVEHGDTIFRINACFIAACKFLMALNRDVIKIEVHEDKYMSMLRDVVVSGKRCADSYCGDYLIAAMCVSLMNHDTVKLTMISPDGIANRYSLATITTFMLIGSLLSSTKYISLTNYMADVTAASKDIVRVVSDSTDINHIDKLSNIASCIFNGYINIYYHEVM